MPPVWLGINNEDSLWKGEENRVCLPAVVILAQILFCRTVKEKATEAKELRALILLPVSSRRQMDSSERVDIFLCPSPPK